MDIAEADKVKTLNVRIKLTKNPTALNKAFYYFDVYQHLMLTCTKLGKNVSTKQYTLKIVLII